MEEEDEFDEEHIDKMCHISEEDDDGLSVELRLNSMSTLTCLLK